MWRMGSRAVLDLTGSSFPVVGLGVPRGAWVVFLVRVHCVGRGEVSSVSGGFRGVCWLLALSSRMVR